MNTTTGSFVTIFLLLFEAFSISAAAQTPMTSAEAKELAKLKARAMSADYRADFKALAEVRDELAKWPENRDLAYLAKYWSGFASWRIALNGANHDMKPPELVANLKNASADFYDSARLKDDFADAYVAASMVNAWLISLEDAKERLAISMQLFAHANALEPKNPRVLWAKGGYYLYRAMRANKDLTPGIDIYKQMIKEVDARGTDASSPLPDWGKPEALMSIAFAYSKANPPDLTAAKEQAAAALKLQPEWSYVRDNLIPSIEKQMAK